ncbi:MAG TPA: primosomal protein N' [Spirochaetota bacterium]|nr:primosomal protein N' [Spirochaetota bacterium]HOM10887.1 primosomal protein N' [Spirochaetota bacterium]HPP50755.1 primosomal protein N' [Spirochaetota bacterium]
MFVDVAVGFPVDGFFTYSTDDTSITKGMRVVVNFNNRKTTGYVVHVHDDPPNFDVKPVIKVLDTQPIFDDRLLRLAQFVSNHYVCYFGEALGTALPSGKSYNIRTKPFTFGDSSKEVILTEEQEQIYRAIMNQPQKVHCIYGITGSGKTEVYIALAKKMIQQGKAVLYLVPEISISSQMFERLKAVFGQTLVMYHSGMNPNQRLVSWKRFYTGQAMIAVGTRSAIFMQAPNLGLIIIDEEHDSSYKENSTPRYHARTVAWYRHRQEGAMLVLGSATPSLETLYAIQRTSIVQHQLNKRFGTAKLPELEIVTVKASNARTIFSNTLLFSIKKAIEAREQVILLLNRRGFAPVMLCQDCGTAVQCPHCSISLTHHKQKLLCHYCHYEAVVPEHCSNCGSKHLVMVGSGTQRVEEVLQKMFPAATVVRLDQDSARRKNFLPAVVNDMMNGNIDILLGTQMVAKGFDFPNVSLVGVMLADIGLLLPDFRAVERTFALLVQVAGRSGRGEVGGKVIVQTINPDNPIFHFLKNHDYMGFCQKELSIRKALNYPPYIRLARLVVRGAKEDIVATVAGQCRDILQELSPQFPDITILGPSQAPLHKIASQYRYHIVLKSNNVEKLSGILAQCKKKVNLQGTYVEIDIDPLDLL